MFGNRKNYKGFAMMLYIIIVGAAIVSALVSYFYTPLAGAGGNVEDNRPWGQKEGKTWTSCVSGTEL